MVFRVYNFRVVRAFFGFRVSSVWFPGFRVFRVSALKFLCVLGCIGFRI